MNNLRAQRLGVSETLAWLSKARQNASNSAKTAGITGLSRRLAMPALSPLGRHLAAASAMTPGMTPDAQSWALLRHAASLNGPTDVALSFADYIDKSNKNARRFEQLTPQTIEFIEEIERVASAPVSLISTRFEKRSIIDRRRW